MATPGKFGVTGTELRFVDGSGDVYAYEGSLTGNTHATTEKVLGIDGDSLYYSDVNGDERVCPTNIGSSVTGVKGSIWIHNSHIKYVDANGRRTEAHSDQYSDQYGDYQDSHSDDHTDSHHDSYDDYYDAYDDHTDDYSDTHSDAYTTNDHADSHTDDYDDNYDDGYDDYDDSYDDHDDSYSDDYTDQYGDHADIRIDRAERVVRAGDPGGSQRVE